MATAATRQNLAARRRADRDRKREQRQRDSEAGVPDRRVIESALAIAVRAAIQREHVTARMLPQDSVLHTIVQDASALLKDSGYRLKSARARSLFKAAIGA